MEHSEFHAGLRRRDVLHISAVSGLALWTESYALGASDFWNKQKPPEWTEQEKTELRTKSPWAKKVDATTSAGGGGGGRGGGSEGGAGGGGGEGGGGGGGGRRGGGGGGGGGGLVIPPSPGGGQATSLEIVWQSAKPIQDAHPIAFPPKLDNHYVISVTGIPMQVIQAAVRGGRGGRGGRGAEEAAGGTPPAEATPAAKPVDQTAPLMHGTTLIVKGKEPQNADVVLSMNNGATLVFGFAKDALPLTVAAKDVDFEVKLGSLSAKAKFSLKDMMYNGELAL